MMEAKNIEARCFCIKEQCTTQMIADSDQVGEHAACLVCAVACLTGSRAGCRNPCSSMLFIC